MSSALAYQIAHGTVGVPLAFPTKTGPRCGHYVQVTTPTGHQGFRFVRDPNTVCGLPSKKADITPCLSNPQACANAQLPPGWQQVGQAAITGRTPAESYGGVAIR
ncbi:MAG: hypothetical protein KGJ45_11530 [Elusimicrobia bacterium]|nr:hypothetical protein [Elusimicrobiota bacterium]